MRSVSLFSFCVHTYIATLLSHNKHSSHSSNLVSIKEWIPFHSTISLGLTQKVNEVVFKLQADYAYNYFILANLLYCILQLQICEIHFIHFNIGST